MHNSDWNQELRARLEPIHLIVFAGLIKNAGKTTALNAVNRLFSGEPLGLTSIGYDGEEKDAIYQHPKPPVLVQQGQLVLTAERFLPENKRDYEILKSWGNHSQFGSWLIVHMINKCNFRMAGPVSLSELKTGISYLSSYGAKRILIDGALNRLSHISFLDRNTGMTGKTGMILSTGAALGESLDDIKSRTRHWLELFALPGISINPSLSRSMPKELDQNAFFFDGKWLTLPAFLWEQNLKDVLPAETEILYLPGAFTDVIYQELRKNQRLPQEFILRSPAHILLSQQVWQGLKARNIRVKLLSRPNLVLLTLSPWHPYQLIPTESLAEALLPFCRVPLVDMQKEEIWMPD